MRIAVDWEPPVSREVEPETCLPASGWEFKKAGKAQVALRNPHPVMKVNRAIMEKSGYRQISYFWFPMRGRILTNAWEMKVYTFWDALTRQRTDGALVRLITPVLQGEQVQDAEARLQEFTKQIVPILDQFLPCAATRGSASHSLLVR